MPKTPIGKVADITETLASPATATTTQGDKIDVMIIDPGDGTMILEPQDATMSLEGVKIESLAKRERCLECEIPFTPKVKGQKFHSDYCRVKHWRKNQAGKE